MRLSWTAIASSALLGVTACKGFPLPWKSEPASADARHEGALAGMSEEPAQVRLELQDIHYDGWSLRGRFLITPEAGSIRLDKRLIESTALSMKSVTDCNTGRPVEFMVMDVFAKPPREEDVLLLKPGYWYGKDIRLPLIAEAPDRQRGPACIHAEIEFHSLEKTPTLLHVRAEIPARSETEAPPGASLD